MKTVTQPRRKLPVIIAIGDFAGGVTSWAQRLRRACENHPRLRIMLMNCSPAGGRVIPFDLEAPTREAAALALARHAPAVIVPNFVFDLYPVAAEQIAAGHDLRLIGYCRADSAREYYDPLAFYEPLVSRFVAVSPRCAERLAVRLPHRAGEIATLPTGVNHPPALARAYRRDPIRLIYAGRVVQHQKRVLDFVPLVQELLARGIDFVFDIVGDGRQFDELRAALALVPHGGRVQLHGRLAPDLMDRVWADHDVFLQTSDFEGTSNSMLESMAQGAVPVLTHTESGLDGIIEPGVNGFVVPVGDMAAMADAIGLLVAQPILLERVGRAAWQTAGRFSIERYVEHFARIVEQAWGAPPRLWPPGRPLEPPEPFFGLRLGGGPHAAPPDSRPPRVRRVPPPASLDVPSRRLLIMFPSPRRGGAEDYTLTIGAAAAAAGWPVHAAFPRRSATESLLADFEASGVRCEPLEFCDIPNPGGIDPRRRRFTRTLRLLNRLRPDCVLLQLCGIRYGLESLLALAWRRVPALVVFQLVREDQPIGPLRRRLYAWARGRGLRTVAVSEANRALLARQFRMDPTDILLIPNGTAIPPAEPPDRRLALRQQLAAQLDLPAEARLLLTVGRLDHQKGHDLLIPAIPHILARHPDARFLWAGEGPLRPQLEQLARDYGVADAIRFLGQREDIPDLLRAADLYLFPTRFEGQPFSLLEAMAHGLPAVTTRASGIAEVVEHMRHALLCRVDDVRDLREAVIWALDHPDRMAAMAREARLRVEDFSESRMIAMTLAALARAPHSSNSRGAA